jgi:hypothetical protein
MNVHTLLSKQQIDDAVEMCDSQRGFGCQRNQISLIKYKEVIKSNDL